MAVAKHFAVAVKKLTAVSCVGAWQRAGYSGGLNVLIICRTAGEPDQTCVCTEKCLVYFRDFTVYMKLGKFNRTRILGDRFNSRSEVIRMEER